MHCHVLDHMMNGMMGSLLIVQGGEIHGQLPRGTTDAVSCRHQRRLQRQRPRRSVRRPFRPSPLPVRMGDVVRWTNIDSVFGAHTVTSDAGSPQSFGSPTLNPVAPGTAAQFQITVATMGNITYHCNFHGEMSGTIQVSM